MLQKIVFISICKYAESFSQSSKGFFRWALVWWKLGVEEWLVKFVKCVTMPQFPVRVKNSSSVGFLAQEELHQGSMLGHLLYSSLSIAIK